MKRQPPISRRAFGSGILCCLALFLTGCSHTRRSEGYGSLNIAVPQVPLFLNGSMSVLLSNRNSYTARVTSEENATTAGFGPAKVSGEFLAADGKLLFAPDEKKPKTKTSQPQGIVFVWDIGQHSGFVRSEAIQGYAPISSGLTFTNIVERDSAAAPDKIEGHICRAQDASVSSGEGLVSSFTVWRTEEPGGLPVRIQSSGSPGALTLTLSKLKPEELSEEIFLPPKEFTRYPNVEAMMTELALREQNFRRRLPSEDWSHSLEAPQVYPNPGQPR